MPPRLNDHPGAACPLPDHQFDQIVGLLTEIRDALTDKKSEPAPQDDADPREPRDI